MMENEQEIIERAQKGDEIAMTLLIEKYQIRLTRFLIGYLGNAEDAMDTAQEAFIKLFLNLDKFKKGKNLSTWLYTIAINQAKDLKSKVYKRKEGFTTEEGNPQEIEKEDVRYIPDAMIEKKHLAESLAKAILSLPEKLKAPFILFHQEKKSLKEIAQITGAKESSVKVQLHRARKYLAENSKELRSFL